MSDDVIDRADADLDQDAPAPLDVVLEVKVVGPVRTQALAVHVPSTRAVILAGDQTEQLLSGDPRRAQMVVISTVNDFYVSPNRADVAQGSCAVWPAQLPLVLHHRGPIYVRNANPAVPTTVSAIVETLQ